MGEGREKRRERGGPRKEFPRPMVTVIENFVDLTGYPTITQHGRARQGTPAQTWDGRVHIIFHIFSPDHVDENSHPAASTLVRVSSWR